MTTELKRMRQLIGSAADWAANDLVIGAGEIALETQSAGDHRAKIGDGVKRYSELPYSSLGQALTINVRDPKFGAVGDGVADDTVAIQAAIDYATTLITSNPSIVNETGARVFFPEGEYLISAPLRAFGTGLQLEGVTRKGSIIHTATPGMTALILGDDSVAHVSSRFGGVSRLGFEARVAIANDTTTVGIQIWNIIEPVFSELYINNFATAIEAHRCYEGVFEKLFMDQRDRSNKGNYALLLTGIAGVGTSVGCHLSDIEVRANAQTTAKWISCVEVRAADGFYMTQCHLYQGDYAFSIRPSGSGDENYIEGFLIENCYFDQATTANVLIGGSFAAGGAYQNIHFSNCYFRAAGIGGLFSSYALRIAISSGPSSPFNFKFTGCTFRTASKSGVSVAGSSTAGYPDIQDLQFIGCTFSDNNRGGAETYSDMSLDCGSVTIVGNTFRAAAVAATSCILHTGTAGGEEWMGIYASNNFAASNYTSKPITTSQTLGIKVSVYGNHHAGRGRHETDAYKLQTTNATATTIWSIPVGSNQSIWARARLHGFSQDGQYVGSYDIEGQAYRIGSAAAVFMANDPVVLRTKETAAGAAMAAVMSLSGNTLQIQVTGIAATTIDWHGPIESLAS